MFVICLAEINICVENKYDYIKRLCRDYITDKTADFSVAVTEAEIMAEDAGKGFDEGYLESLAIYRKIAEKILEYNGFLLHGAVIDVNDCGIAFLAKSGVGKSTHLKLWKELLKNKVTVVNGDKPLIRIIDGKIFAYGTPWAGKENMHTNTKTELKKICFIERLKENECVCINKNEIFERLINQIYMPFKALEQIERTAEKAEFYLIKCNTDISAAKTAYRCIFGGSEPLLEEALRENNIFIAKTRGDSMHPMLTEGRDKVVITPPVFPLKKYDVPVYRRDGHYTMHRIIKVTKKGYLICGDNRTHIERDITDREIVGVMTAFYHNGKFIKCTDKNYIKYSKRICRGLPVRIIKNKLRRIFRKLSKM